MNAPQSVLMDVLSRVAYKPTSGPHLYVSFSFVMPLRITHFSTFQN